MVEVTVREGECKITMRLIDHAVSFVCVYFSWVFCLTGCSQPCTFGPLLTHLAGLLAPQSRKLMPFLKEVFKTSCLCIWESSGRCHLRYCGEFRQERLPARSVSSVNEIYEVK